MTLNRVDALPQDHRLLHGRPFPRSRSPFQVSSHPRRVLPRNDSIRALYLFRLRACVFRNGGVAILSSSLCNLFLMTYAGQAGGMVFGLQLIGMTQLLRQHQSDPADTPMAAVLLDTRLHVGGTIHQ